MLKRILGGRITAVVEGEIGNERQSKRNNWWDVCPEAASGKKLELQKYMAIEFIDHTEINDDEEIEGTRGRHKE